MTFRQDKLISTDMILPGKMAKTIHLGPYCQHSLKCLKMNIKLLLGIDQKSEA